MAYLVEGNLSKLLCYGVLGGIGIRKAAVSLGVRSWT